MDNLVKHYYLKLFLCFFPLFSYAQNPTPDVFDLFDNSVLNVDVCPGYGLGQPVDLYQDGVADTMVVINNAEGKMSLFNYNNGTDNRLLFTYIDNNCGGSYPYSGKGKVVIRFVDMLAPGFDAQVPSSWTYTKVPALEFSISHDACFDYDNDPNPYLQAIAYRNIQQGDFIASTNGFNHNFSDPIGIGELYVNSDYCENVINDLILYDAETGQGSDQENPAVSILMDTSGSMNWSHDGTINVPLAERRITLAKNAVEPFLLMMNDHYSGSANFGVAAFPSQSTGACSANVERPMEAVSTAAINDTINNTLPGLQVGGSTPLLAGISEAASMFTDQAERAIVLLSDGYHNCPNTASPNDADVVDIINDLNQAGVVLNAIGFGRPTDIDHPLLEAFSQQTSGEFYDVTQAAFDPYSWDPAVALQETYKNIAVNTLGLQSIVDPIESLRAKERRTHSISLSAFENKVTFFTSWACERANVSVTLLDSFGKQVPTNAKGTSFHANKNYWLLTLDSAALAHRVGPSPWTLHIEGTDICGKESMSYQYSVLGQSELKMQAIAHAEQYRPGAPVKLLAKLSLEGRPVIGQEILVEVMGAAGEKGELPKPETFWLRDDGKKGDKYKNDGVYSYVLEGGHEKAGTYTYNFSLQGRSGRRDSFERYIRLKQSYGNRENEKERRVKLINLK